MAVQSFVVMRDAFGHCEALVREADKDRFLATLFAPAHARPALHALYAFNIEVARVGEAARELLAGEIRLQWWREVLAGERTEEARGHPVAMALIDVVTRHGLPQSLFDEMIEARRLDLAGEPLHSVAELEDYCRGTSSTLMELAARILDPTVSAEGLGFVGPCGISVAAAGLLRAFPLHASRGRLLIPGEVLARHGVDPHDILAGRSSPGLVAALAALRAVAASHYASARPAVAPARPGLAAAWLPAALVPRYLGALERSSSEPFRGVDVPQWRRQWILWRAARSGRLPQS